MKRILIYFLLSACCYQTLPAFAEEGLAPLEKSEAYQSYLRRPRTDLARLIFLLDRFMNSPYEIILDGYAYDSSTAIKYARGYLASHYKKNEKADSWIRKHAYRTDSGKIIYVRLPGHKELLLRDFLLKELAALHRQTG